MTKFACLALLALTVPALGQGVEHQHPRPQVLAPGYGPLQFTPPAPGSYKLPPLGQAADGAVLDSSGGAGRLHGHLDGKIAVLSFIYTSCGDLNGCPLATHVLRTVQRRLLGAPDLASQVRLLSFSFDPERDTPRVLQKYSSYFRAPESDWRFLTSRSEEALSPVLKAYDQWVIRDPTGAISHLLRVFLIDRRKRIRNIYSVSFLHADTLLNDIRTLLQEERAQVERRQIVEIQDGAS